MAHLTAIVLVSTRIAQLRSPTRPPTYRLKGASRALQCTAAAATLGCLAIVLVQLVTRVRAETDIFLQGDTAPFEWAGEEVAVLLCSPAPGLSGYQATLRAGFGTAIVSWALITAALLVELDHYSPSRSWLLRFPVLFIFAGQLAKLRRAALKMQAHLVFAAASAELCYVQVRGAAGPHARPVFLALWGLCSTAGLACCAGAAAPPPRSLPGAQRGGWLRGELPRLVPRAVYHGKISLASRRRHSAVQLQAKPMSLCHWDAVKALSCH